MGQVKEHMWKPPVLIPSEKEESCEVCGAGKTELLLGKCLSPHRERPHKCRACSAPQVQSLVLALPVSTLAAPQGQAPRERLGYPGAAGLGACDCVCERTSMDTWNPGTSVSRLGVTMQELCSPALDVPEAGGSL